MNAWLFQSNPRRFLLDDYLLDAMKNDYIVMWKIGQKFYIDSIYHSDGVYIKKSKGDGLGYGKIITLPESTKIMAGSKFWIDPPSSKEFLRVKICLEEIRIFQSDEMLFREILFEDSVLKNLKIFKIAHQTNYLLETNQADELRSCWVSHRISK